MRRKINALRRLLQENPPPDPAPTAWEAVLARIAATVGCGPRRRPGGPERTFEGVLPMTTATKQALCGAVLGALALAAGGGRADDGPGPEVNVGDLAPAFEAPDDLGQPWKSADHVGKKYVVVYFFPGDFTPGCTAQAQHFRDAMNKLNDEGVEVVGVSGDAVQTHQLFKKAQKLNFTLLSDEEGRLAGAFGVPVGKGAEVKTKDADGQPLTVKRPLTASRWTFVIGKDGRSSTRTPRWTRSTTAKEVADLIGRLGNP